MGKLPSSDTLYFIGGEVMGDYEIFLNFLNFQSDKRSQHHFNLNPQDQKQQEEQEHDFACLLALPYSLRICVKTLPLPL